MEPDDFGEPVPFRDPFRIRIFHKIQHYGKIIVPVILVIASIVTILGAFGIIQPISPEEKIEEKFDTRIVGDFTEVLYVDLTEFFIPYTAESKLYVEGVVPNPGWVKITIENFTHHPNYKQNALQLPEIETWDKIEFSVDRGNFNKEVDVKLRFHWKKTLDYPVQSSSYTHGPIGNIFLKAEYYDSTKQLSEVFYITPYLTGRYFSP